MIIQPMIKLPPYHFWQITNKCDSACVALADRHYSRQKVGANQFTRPGKNLVLRTAAGDAVWVSWYGIRDDGRDCYECTIFRNESGYLSSDMIREAVEITYQKWGYKTFITTIKPSAVRSSNKGCCFKKAGFRTAGRTKVHGLIILELTKQIQEA